MYNLNTINSKRIFREGRKLMSSLESQELLSAINNIIVKQLDKFEKRVNNRFDKIEEQIKVIPKMQEDIRNIQEQIKVIPGMQSNIESMQSNIDKMQNSIEIMQEDIKKLQDNYEELYTETRNISRAVARIEAEHGEKLAILFDAVTGNIEKQEKLENRLDKCENRIENNEHQIYFLDSKIQNL